MRMSRDEKERSHARIVASASRLFREKGIEGASVAEVMGEAGMTIGGFYKHFETKDALVAAALDEAFATFVGSLEGVEEPSTYDRFKTLYLSGDHRRHAGRGCPVAALGAEIGRAPTALKASFGFGVRRVVAAIAATRRGSGAARRAAALREFSMLVGAMVIARAADPALGDEVLAACAGTCEADA